MLSTKNRLSRKKEFDNIFQNGRSSYSTILGVKTIPNQLEYNRFGILVSTKISKKAVQRNKIKRRLRAVLFEINKELAVGYDFVIITLPPIINADFEELKKELTKNISKLLHD